MDINNIAAAGIAVGATILAFAALSSCSPKTVPVEDVVVYFKDPTTGLCFSGFDRNGDGVAEANWGHSSVECTPAVEARIEHFKQIQKK